MQAPHGIVGLQPGLIDLYGRAGHHRQEAVLIIYPEQEAYLRDQPYRKGVTEIDPLEIVGSFVADHHRLRAAVGVLYRAADQRAAIEPEPDEGSAPIKIGTKHEFHRHIDIFQGIFGAGLEPVGIVIIPVRVRFATGADIFDRGPQVEHVFFSAVQRYINENAAIELGYRAAVLDRNVPIAIVPLDGIREPGKIRAAFDTNGDLSMSGER